MVRKAGRGIWAFHAWRRSILCRARQGLCHPGYAEERVIHHNVARYQGASSELTVVMGRIETAEGSPIDPPTEAIGRCLAAQDFRGLDQRNGLEPREEVVDKHLAERRIVLLLRRQVSVVDNERHGSADAASTTQNEGESSPHVIAPMIVSRSWRRCLGLRRRNSDLTMEREKATWLGCRRFR